MTPAARAGTGEARGDMAGGRAEEPLVAGLLRPEAYPPPPPTRVELVTTHISWVFLTDHDVWKVKRPVDYGFVDYTTLERRRRLCEEEVRLNRRLAPDVYRGVVPVRRGPAGPTLTGEGPVIDYAVRMRRLPEAASAEALVRAGRLTHDHLWRVAEVLARFYDAAPETPAYGAIELIRTNVDENFEQVRPFVGDVIDAGTYEAVRDRQLAYLERHAARLRERVARGRIREGHGDLRLEHVYFETDAPVIIDCIEFNERFRMGDVASDAAFLAMELDARERPDLAASFLARFGLESNDYDLYGVVDFYLSYRAWVRAKVAALLAVDPSTAPEKAARKREEARRLFAAAERHTRPPPGRIAVVAVGGVIGTGKTVLAEALVRALGAPAIESDRTRKWLAGVAPTRRAPAAAYSAEASRRTFDEMFRRAAVVLESGRPVVLDATFRDAGLRRRARELARAHGARFLLVETTCDDAVLRERLRARAAGPSVSDATEELLARMRAEFQPITELDPAEHLVVDTTRPLAEQVARVRETLAGAAPAR